ncbi:MAG: muramoyltetrapeptide carboxypeptidase [Sphingomonadales bacterium]|jgi:muramoyltetrapeptide carboxypeptidase|nr:muramoyltetrapeptide carboxypeptidase [Sphingomonadales bacterium]
MRIAVVAPSSRFDDWQEVAARVTAIAADAHPNVEISFHPQCGRIDHHFAGTDAEREEALVEVANDPGVDAIWFARGGYGSNHIAERALARFEPSARDKAWLGYSDAGFLLAGLYRAGYANVAHGPMPRDVVREGGEAAVRRALAWLTGRSPAALEPKLEAGRRYAAFNITVYGMLLGTALEPDLADHVLLLEEVAEHLYATDRAMFHIAATPSARRLAGIRLGRVVAEPNDPPFGHDEDSIVRRWSERYDIPYLGRADIGHDSANKVVPFGLL